MAINIPGLSGYDPSKPAQQLNIGAPSLQGYNTALSAGVGNQYLSNYNVQPGSKTGYQAPQVLGIQAPTGGGGGGDSRLTQLSQTDRNPIQETEYQNMLAAQRNSAQSQYDAQLGAENTAYDYNAQQLNDQLGTLGGQKERAIGEIDLGLSGVQNQINSAKTNAQTGTTSQINQAGSIAKSTQQQNRNVLRALGIINSTAAGELLSKPINEFDKQRATLNQAFQQKSTELDDTLTQKTAEANNAKNGIIAQFTDLVGKIQTDLRFNERQRLDAVKQANSALQQRLADIQGSVLQYQQQVNLQKQQFAQSLAQIAAQQNPQIASDYMKGIGLSTPGNQQIGAAVQQTTKKWNPLKGQYE